ncbi:MAG: universal stress protein [Chloroflexi bacterium]|nr:universal stress protein [Chloroflexota bacterium]
MFERILAPLDGSKLAEQALPYVIELARAFGSGVVLLEVCEPEEKESGRACRLYVNSKAEELKEVLAGSAARVTSVVLEGRAAYEIMHYAETNDVSLIVISTHGRSGLMRPWLLGSSAEKLVSRVGIPLLVIRAREPPALPERLFGCILVPLDGSKRGEAALPYIVALARQFESEVILLQVIESGRYVHSVRGVDFLPFKDRDMAATRTRAQSYLQDVATRFAGSNAKTIYEVRAGDAAQEIIKFAGECHCHLIAMASHGHSGLETWAVGSITHKVLQASDVPLLIVRAPK